MTSVADYAAWRHVTTDGFTPPASTSTTLWTVSNDPIRARIVVYVTGALSGSVDFTIANDGANLCAATACPTAAGSILIPATVGLTATTATGVGGLRSFVSNVFECQPSTITLATSATVTGTIVADMWYIPLGSATVA